MLGPRMVSFHPDAHVADLEMRAVLYVLVAFAYADGRFDAAERSFVRDTIDGLLAQRARELFGDDVAAANGSLPRWRSHFYDAVNGMEHEIRADSTESVAEGESSAQFATARVELRCFELAQRLGSELRIALLRLVDGLIASDGRVHAAEARLRADLESLLLRTPPPPPTFVEGPRSMRGGAFIVGETTGRTLEHADHGFFRAAETAYAREPSRSGPQFAADLELIQQTEARLWQQRRTGQGRLAMATSFNAFAGGEAFMDEFIVVRPPRAGVTYELTVLGDLHGCYSCLKAAVMQDAFLARVDAYRAAPERAPYPVLILLGDYIDRGLYSYDGILRTALRLYLAAPEHVVVLRGNHEHYMTRDGLMQSPVRPAEALASIVNVAPRALLDAHHRLFELLPNAMVFGRTLFVHGGIPRDATLARKPSTLAALNDPEVRQEMLWSDPSDADEVPDELQRACTRFAFGRAQLKRFLGRLGCTTIIRGHERIVEGMRVVYRDPEATLISLFSAGGAHNDDLPPTSNYREVTPMALSIRHADNVTRVTPFPIAYARYRDRSVNAFLTT
jgi:hypothetical protein